ncbi:MAG: ABC transporter permease [Burkholderiaceae bacterium]|nr:MAG: ABC transporter permease [Burkholderiaceae bacterium]TBR76618.1 MAG: ABC transporter permease [Burkholderiaceae bacterium]
MLQSKLKSARFWLLSGVGSVGFLGLWAVAAQSGIVPSTFLPGPLQVVQRFVQMTHEPFAGYTLQIHVLSSLGRFLLGFCLAVCVGIPLGLSMAWFRFIDRLITPLFEAVRFVAPIAWVPFAALWFGTGIGGPVLVIFTGAFPPVLINTYRGAKFVDRKYIEASSMLGAGSWRGITEVLLPAAVPSIVAGLRISAGLGWQSLVGAELIVASSGVGYVLVKGQASLSTATVMSGMIAIGIVGLLIDVLLRKLQQTIEARRGL